MKIEKKKLIWHPDIRIIYFISLIIWIMSFWFIKDITPHDFMVLFIIIWIIFGIIISAYISCFIYKFIERYIVNMNHKEKNTRFKNSKEKEK